MSTINIDLAADTILNVMIGQQDENEVREVVFDFSGWYTTYGSGTISLAIQRPKDEWPYEGTLTVDSTNHKATWEISETDTAYAGTGQIQLSYKVGDAKKKSVVYRFTCHKSLGALGSVVTPVQIQTFIDEVEESLQTMDGRLDDMDDQIADVKQDFHQLESTTLDTNLFDKSIATDNARIGTNGALVNPADGYFASDWIAVESGVTYIKNSPVMDAYHRVAFYNSAKDFISVSNDNIFTAPNFAKYIRFCGIMSEKNTAWLSKATAKDDEARYAIQSLPYVGFCPKLRNGTAQETGNTQQVCVSEIIPYGKATSIIVLVNKPVSADGNYWRVVFTTYSVDSGKPEDNNGNRVTMAVAIDDTEITIHKNTFDYTSKGFAFALAEKNAQGSVIAHRITDFSAGDIVVIKNHIPNDNEKGQYEYEGQKVSLKNKLDCFLFMELSKPSGITQTYQGIAVYNNTMLQGFDAGYWGMYNLATRSQTAIASGQLEGATSTLHFNSCCFGAKYSPSDDYPLLYSTGGSTGTLNPSGVDDHSYCVVHRFVKVNNVLTAKLIQHIYVDMSGFEAGGYHENYGGGNFMVEDGYLYVFSSLYRTNGSEESRDNVNKFVVHKYKVPSTSEAVVTYTVNDVIEEFLFDYDTWYMQGGTIHDGVIYHAFGMGGDISGASSKPKNNAIRAYNVIGGMETAKIDGTILPYASREPEGLAVYDGKLLANTDNGNVYALDFH